MLRSALLFPFMLAFLSQGTAQLTLLDPTFGTGGMVLPELHVFNTSELLSRTLVIPSSVADGTYTLWLTTSVGMTCIPVVLHR